jgi:hypothetical protein
MEIRFGLFTVKVTASRNQVALWSEWMDRPRSTSGAEQTFIAQMPAHMAVFDCEMRYMASLASRIMNCSKDAAALARYSYPRADGGGTDARGGLFAG